MNSRNAMLFAVILVSLSASNALLLMTLHLMPAVQQWFQSLSETQQSLLRTGPIFFGACGAVAAVLSTRKSVLNGDNAK